METEPLLSTLRAHEPELRRRGVGRIAVFGSAVRNDAGPLSDIDLLLELNPDAKVGYFEYAGLKLFLRELFPVPVDVADRKQSKPYVRATAEREAVYAL